MKQLPRKKLKNFILKMSTITLVLGILSIASSFYIGNAFFKTTVNDLEQQYRKFYLREAKILMKAVSLHQSTDDNIILNDIGTIWNSIDAKSPDEYICIVDEKSELILHTAHPSTVGNFAGENIIFGEPDMAEKCLGDLVKSKRDYVGDYISSSGQDQLAAFSSVPDKNWVIGVHRSKEALINHIESKLENSKTGFFLISALLIPLSWGILFITFLISERNRKKIEEDIIKREIRYRRILETAIDGFWITDTNGNFLEVNEAYSKMSGYNQNELLAMKISDIEANENPDDVKKHLEKGISRGYDRFESLHRKKDNSVYPVEVNFTFSDNEGGRFVVFVKDISERKKSESELIKNQYYLTKAQEIGKIGTWELDIPKNTLRWTDENYKIFGVPLGTELNYELFLSCIHPEDREYVNKRWNEALKTKSYDIMHRIVDDNTVKWVREKADIEFDSEGKPTIAIGFTQDLTGLKEIETALQESEKKFKTMFEKAPLSYQSLDENGNFKAVNQTWLKSMGYTRGEVLGKNFSEFLVPEWKNHFKENFPRFKAVGEILGVEFEMVKKNGEVILVSFHGKIAKNEKGDFNQTHCIFQDITSLRQAEETSNRYKERLESLWNITKIADSD